MATTSTYITRNDLSLYSKSVLSLISQRDTKINENKNDIDALKQAIEDLDTGLHYVGDVDTLPTTAVDGSLYQVVGSTTTAVDDGWYFYSVDSTAWKNLSTGGSGTDADAAHYLGEVTTVPAAPKNGDMYYFNVPGTTAQAEMTGIKLYDTTAAMWRSMGGVNTSDLATVNIDFTTEIDQ